jgi:leucyl-tRNA synthetase
MQKNDIEKLVMNHEKTRTYLKEAEPKRIIIVLNKIINIVF